MPKAPASTRSSGQVNLTFGLINIAVSLYTGTVSQHGVQRKEYRAVPVMEEDGLTQKVVKREKDDGTFEEVPVVEDHPVGRGQIDKVTGVLIAATDVVRKIETEYGPVYVEDHEIEHLFELAPDTIKVKGFQPVHLFHQGHYVPKSLMHLQPATVVVKRKKQPDPIATKLLLTMFAAMRKHGAMAVVETTTRGVPKPGVLLPDGTLWNVWHTDALREQRPLPDPSPAAPVVDAEVNMFGMLIDSMWSTDPIDLSDKRSELIQAFADEKAAAGDFGKPSDDTAAQPVVQAAAPDLMALLAASMDAAKKGA